MNIELLIGTEDGKGAFMPAAESAEWQTEISGSAGKLTCNILCDRAFEISEGVPIRFKADGKRIFFGYVFGKTAGADGRMRLVCYDQIRYLLNKDTYVYEGKTASQLLTLIAEDFSLRIGSVEDSKYVIPYRVEENSMLLDMIENAIELTYHNSGKRYVLYDEFGRLCFREITSVYGGGRCLLIGGGSGEELSVVSSIDKGVYNKVKLFYNSRKSGSRDIYTAYDSKNAKKWGVLQYTGSLKEGENGQAKAEELLKLYGGKNFKVEVKGAFGDTDLRAGCAAAVSRKVFRGMGGEDKDRYMLAERVVHRFSGQGHFMDIVLTDI
ncbi:MAG: hydrolase [Ruminiclostridium sp.]|nr:hydrolase [Ruminiclostridium sp.]